jgi:hypothetical protein
MILVAEGVSILMAGRPVQYLTNRAVVAHGRFPVNLGWHRDGAAMVPSIATGRDILRRAKRICGVGETDPPSHRTDPPAQDRLCRRCIH